MAEPVEEVAFRHYEKIVRETNTNKFWQWTITRTRDPKIGVVYCLQVAWGRRGTRPRGQLGDKETGDDLGLLTWKAMRKAEVKLSEGYVETIRRVTGEATSPFTRGSAFTGPGLGRSIGTGVPNVVVGVDWGEEEARPALKLKAAALRVAEIQRAQRARRVEEEPEPVEPLIRERRVKLTD